MPRKARVAPGGWAYHIINRGNRRARIFASDGDYSAFMKAMADALDVVPMRILAWCLMPNHWHLVLWPNADGELSRFVGWISNTHVRRYNRFHGLDGRGHLYQGRFKSFPIQEDHHLLCVLRYVEANAVRAGLVQTAADWPWCSLATGTAAGDDRPDAGRWRRLLADWPVERPDNWAELVDQRMEEPRLSELRCSLERGRPYGAADWVQKAVTNLGLLHTMRTPGRPRRPAHLSSQAAVRA